MVSWSYHLKEFLIGHRVGAYPFKIIPSTHVGDPVSRSHTYATREPLVPPHQGMLKSFSCFLSDCFTKANELFNHSSSSRIAPTPFSVSFIHHENTALPCPPDRLFKGLSVQRSCIPVRWYTCQVFDKQRNQEWI